jgi:peptide/nickel transport system permease protein
MLPMTTLIAINLGVAVGGAIQTETVFSWPGLGRLMYDSIIMRDYPLLQGSFLIFAISVLVANFLADIFYAYLDPRIKY